MFDFGWRADFINSRDKNSAWPKTGRFPPGRLLQ